MEKENKRFFRIARKTAEKSKEKYKIGCVVVFKGKVLSVGYNCSKTHPLQKTYNRVRFKDDSKHSLHAETSAISKLKYKDVLWNKVDIYVYRITNMGTGLARPCKSCMTMLKRLGVHSVYYTTDSQSFQHEVI